MAAPWDGPGAGWETGRPAGGCRKTSPGRGSGWRVWRGAQLRGRPQVPRSALHRIESGAGHQPCWRGAWSGRPAIGSDFPSPALPSAPLPQAWNRPRPLSSTVWLCGGAGKSPRGGDLGASGPRWLSSCTASPRPSAWNESLSLFLPVVLGWSPPRLTSAHPTLQASGRPSPTSPLTAGSCYRPADVYERDRSASSLLWHTDS